MEEELQQHLEIKAKNKDRLLAAEEAAAHREAHARQAKEAHTVHHARVVATLAERARESAIAAKVTLEEA